LIFLARKNVGCVHSNSNTKQARFDVEERKREKREGRWYLAVACSCCTANVFNISTTTP